MAKLYFNYGTMGSGKSLELIRAAYNYLERGMGVVVLASAIDSRTPVSSLSCRLQGAHEFEVFPVFPNTTIDDIKRHLAKEFEKTLQPPAAIFVDEAHFLTSSQIVELAKLVDSYQIPILCYGLRTDFLGNLFEGSKALMEYSDIIREIKSVCWCGKAAKFNARIAEDGYGKPIVVREGDVVQVGGNESYIGLCREHYTRGQLKSTIGREV